MSKFELSDAGGGRFALSGQMSFDTVGQILRVSEEMFEAHTRIEVDLFEVTDTDSAGLALLLEWITWANHTVREIRFVGTPEKIEAWRTLGRIYRRADGGVTIYCEFM